MQLQMRRSLENLPEQNLDPGYSLRSCTPDDVPALAHVLTESFAEPWSLERAGTEFFLNPHVRKTFAIVHQRQIVATASVQMIPENGPDMGTVHWVGALPSHAGHRLGYEVCLAVLHEMKRMGCTRANLTTDDPRLAAIRTYFKLGFEPYHCDPTHPDRWAAVMEKLNNA